MNTCNLESAGIPILVKEWHLKNANLPILVICDGIKISLMFEMRNAHDEMILMFDGMTNLVIERTTN